MVSVRAPRLLAGAVAGALVVAVGAFGATAAAAPGRSPGYAGARPAAVAAGLAASAVVVVAAPGLRAADLSPAGTPTLWRLARRGGLAALSTRADPASPTAGTCPLDGWATLAAGERLADRTDRGGPAGGCPELPPTGAGTLPGSLDRLAADTRTRFGTGRVAALGTALHRAGRCTGAVGSGATLAAADRSGRVDVRSADPADPAAYRCPFTAVAADGLLRTPDRRVGARAVDRTLAAVQQARPAGSLLLVVGLGETRPAQPRLHVAVAAGPGLPAGWLRSGSTQRTPYVQLVDVAPTVLAALDVAVPAAMSGRPVTAVPDQAPVRERVAALVDAGRAARAQQRLLAPYLAALLGAQALAYLLAAAVRAGAPRRRACVRRAVALVAVAGTASVPATFLANLVPWWRAGAPLAAALGATAAATALLVALAYAGPWRRNPAGPPVAAAAAGFAVLAGDLLTGAHLQLASMLGYNPIVAGRFVGVGNVAYAVYASAALITAGGTAGAALAAGAGRRSAAALAGALGVFAVVVDGAPAYGADFGGVLALVPAVGLLVLLLTDARVTLPRLAALAAAAVAAVAAFAFADYARPPTVRTHLGRFVADLLSGRAGPVVGRKADANFDLLVSSPLTVVVPLALLALAWALRRPRGGLRVALRAAAYLRAGMLALVVMAALAFVVNDSGIAIPAAALMLAVPVLIAAAAARPHPATDPAAGLPTDAPPARRGATGPDAARC